ncbi:unnamed protein product [Rotaria sp. Silwood2]|nr:unnamed protein product [Rotaria sp. Silwood2]
MGVFFLGFFFPQANRRGGLIGFLASLALQLWIFLGAQITKNQIPSKILELTIDNCTDPVNITNTTTTTLSPPTIKQDPLIDFYSVSYMWYTTIAVLAVLIVGVIVSYLTHPLKPNEIDPKLIIPIGNVCCCCLPERIRDFLRCGVDYENYFQGKKVCI